MLAARLHHDRSRGSHAVVAHAAVVHAGVVLLPVLCFPCVINLETSVELLAASFEQIDVARRVDGVAELGVLPLAQVVLVGHGAT